jgi:Glycosyl transferase family 2
VTLGARGRPSAALTPPARPHAARYPSRVTDQSPLSGPPAEISQLVRERAEARASRDWSRADELKARIEAAGWRVVDRGRRSSVHPAAPPTVEIDGQRRYGSAADVPSALDAPATAAWTVLLLASEEPARVSRLLAALRAHAPAGTHVVVVENDPSEAQVQALADGAQDRSPIAGREPEIIRTSVRLGYAAALNVGLRRAIGELVLLADGAAVPTGDALTPLAQALQDPDVAIAGGYGLTTEADAPFQPGSLARLGETDADAASGRRDVAALEGAWLAFRRDDLRWLGSLDEHFVTPAWLDVWLSLRLRARAEGFGEEDEERDGVGGFETGAEPDSAGAREAEARAPEPADLPAPRRALSLELPLVRDETAWPPERTRLNRRNMYRVLDAFGWRDDLG